MFTETFVREQLMCWSRNEQWGGGGGGLNGPLEVTGKVPEGHTGWVTCAL